MIKLNIKEIGGKEPKKEKKPISSKYKAVKTEKKSASVKVVKKLTDKKPKPVKKEKVIAKRFKSRNQNHCQGP